MPLYTHDPVNNLPPVSPPAASPRPGAAGGILDKDAFLSLLITQLKYQDPLNPMDDTQFVAQMAQFASLEQMQNMSRAMSLTQGYGMIGSIVSGAARGETGIMTEVSGVAQGVSVKNGEIYIMVSGTEVPIGSITAVFGERGGED